jgi:hypothetical protein
VWLKENVDLKQHGLVPVTCNNYEKFSSGGNFESVSLIFATGYLGNPASYYGHLLLRINANSEINTKIENIAVNYGARIPNDENMFNYVLNGLVGNYPSTFTPKEFYYHMHNYGDGEMRDMWEYELDLNPLANELLVAHAWEMQGVTHDYYFLNRNCAYRMAELIELATDQSITRDYLPWEAPQSILQRLQEATFEGKRIIKTVNYWPSRQSKLYQKYAQLSASEREWIKSFIAVDGQIITAQAESLNVQSKIRALDTLLDYYQFILPQKTYRKDPRYTKVLAKRFSLPEAKPSFTLETKNHPHLGHKPSYTSLSAISYQNLGKGVRVRVRPAYYDTLDAGHGHIKGASLTMMEIAFTQFESETQIDYLNILSIENLNIDSTKLANDNPLAWSLNVAAEKMDNSCVRCLGFAISAGRGYTTHLANDVLWINTMFGLGAKGESLDVDAFHADLRVQVNYQINDRLNFMLKSTQRAFIKKHQKKHIYNASIRYEISKNTDFRFGVNKNRSTEVSAGVGFYW